MNTILAVGGSDSGAAAGIQADVKTVAAHGAYAVTAVTAVTAQSRSALLAAAPVSAPLLAAQLRALFDDFDIAAAKTGMLADLPRTQAVADAFERRRPPHYVLDPALAATAGGALLAEDAIGELLRRLVPLAELVTPNAAEAERLAGVPVRTLEDARRAADAILGHGCGAVLVKGGHLADSPGTDLLATAAGDCVFFRGEMIGSDATRGTGCALAAAIAANLADGASLECAVAAAKRYVAGAIRSGPAVGSGLGPMHHGYALRRVRT